MKIKLILKWITRAILVALVLAFLVGFVAYWRSTNDCDRKTASDQSDESHSFLRVWFT